VKIRTCATGQRILGAETGSFAETGPQQKKQNLPEKIGDRKTIERSTKANSGKSNPGSGKTEPSVAATETARRTSNTLSRRQNLTLNKIAMNTGTETVREKR
jgi:hypothetical protein